MSRCLSALAEIKLSRHDWQGAQKIGESLVQLENETSMADQILGAAFAGENNSDQSIEFFEHGVAAAPNTVGPLENLVKALIHNKQTGRALSLLQNLLRQNPNNAQLYLLLGAVEIAEKAPDQAVNAFKTAIEKQPKNSKAYAGLAALYWNRKNTDAAEW